MGTEEVVKTEEAVPAESPSPVESQIIRQIEYYFGNYNLCRDKFLRQQIGVDDGWVPLETLVKFNRLKKLSEDFTVIVEALKKSPKQLMEVNEDCTKIRRRVAEPIPDDYHKREEMLDKKTLYVKGFKRTNTLDELLDFFRDHSVEHVLMRRNFRANDKPFKGSVFVTFEREEDAKKFLEDKSIKYNGVDLLKEWKTDYVKRKDEFFKNLKEEKAKKLENKVAAMNEKNQGKNEVKVIPGCLLKLSGLQSDVLRENLKEVFEEFGTVVYVDYSKGQPTAVIRFESGIAKSVFEKLPEKDGGRRVEVCSSDAEVFLVEGEDESEYWKNIEVSRAQSRLKFNKGFKSHHKGGNKGRFKHWGKRKGNSDRGEDECPKQKKVKTENEKPEAESSGEKKEVKMEADS